jgi:hypothetical protein
MRMSDPEIALFDATVQRGGHYLEYGAGGSTLRVARLPQVVNIISVESDPAYVRHHLAGDALVQAATQSGRLRFLLADIGPIGEWGHPLDVSREYLWPNYALGPYRHGYRPDVILIDGRFRVACGLVAMLQAPQVTMLIHDYTDRSHYHVLEPFLKIDARAETLVRCRRHPQFDEAAARNLLRTYLYCPDDSVPREKSWLKRRVSRIKRKFARH